MNKQQCWGKATVIAAAVALSLSASNAFAGKPAAPKCTTQNIQGSVGAAEQIPDTLCWKFPVAGTLSGTYTSCIVSDPAGNNPNVPPGWSFFSLGPDPDVYSAYWDEFIETSQGRVDLKSYGAGFFSNGLQVVLSKVTGTSGKHAGATGVFSMIIETHSWDPDNPYGTPMVARLTGYLCTP